METTLYFPDYVDGDGWSVQLVLSNFDPDAAAEVRIEVYDPDGQPVLDLFDSDLTLEIPTQGSRVVRSAGSGAIRRGWIQVDTDAATVSGLLTYRHAQSGIEVGVEPVEPGNHFALFVEESSEIGTGLAIFKPDSSPQGLKSESATKKGGTLWTGCPYREGDFHQLAWTMLEWFDVDGVDTEFLGDFRGLLFLRTEDGSPFVTARVAFREAEGFALSSSTGQDSGGRFT